MKNYLELMKKSLLFALRVIIGCAFIKTGYDLANGSLPGLASFQSDPITPMFIILLGCYTLFSSILRLFRKQ